MADDRLVAHQNTNELEVGSFGNVDGNAVSVRYPLKATDDTPLGVAAYVKLDGWILTVPEARALALLLNGAATQASSEPVYSASEVWQLFHRITTRSGC